MSDEKRTILEMLAEGKITQEQADQLLDALGGAEETETEPEAEQIGRASCRERV